MATSYVNLAFKFPLCKNSEHILKTLHFFPNKGNASNSTLENKVLRPYSVETVKNSKNSRWTGAKKNYICFPDDFMSNSYGEPWLQFVVPCEKCN